MTVEVVEGDPVDVKLGVSVCEDVLDGVTVCVIVRVRVGDVVSVPLTVSDAVRDALVVIVPVMVGELLIVTDPEIV